MDGEASSTVYEGNVCIKSHWGNCFSEEEGDSHPLSHQNPQALLIRLRIETGTVLPSRGHFIVLSVTFSTSVTSPCLAIVIFHSVLFPLPLGNYQVRKPIG